VCAACYQQICHWIKFEEKAAESQKKTSSAETLNIQTAASSEGEIPSASDLVKKHNLKSFSVNITRLSQTELNKYKPVENSVTESCDQQVRNVDLQESASESAVTNYVNKNVLNENDVKIKSEPQPILIEIKNKNEAKINFDDKKSESKPNLVKIKIKSEAKSELGELCSNIHDVRAALICNLSSRQNKNHNAARNELGIKTENIECSDIGETPDNANYISGE
jgi:hypothetical protein